MVLLTTPAQKIFKYLPTKYVEQLLDGELLFRNLVYFKRIEFDPRNDIYEGKHIDAPDHDVDITIVATGRRISGRFAYHNALKHMDRVFCFCTSLRLGIDLKKFGDSCVEITDPREFIRRVEQSLKRRNRLSRLEEPLLVAKPVIYYKVNEAAPLSVDVKNPLHLPFLKRAKYADEEEFRFVFARKGGFELKQMIVNSLFNESDEIAQAADSEIVIKVDSIRDIASRVDL